MTLDDLKKKIAERIFFSLTNVDELAKSPI